MVMCEANGSHRHVNQALCKMLGYTLDEMLSLSPRDITHPEDRDISGEAMRRLWSGDQPVVSLEKRYLHKDGRTVWSATSVSVVRDGQGAVLYALGQTHDITEAKRATEELDRARQQMEQRVADGIRELRDAKTLQEKIFTGLNDAVIVVDATLWVIIYCNPAVKRVFGYEPNEMLGRTTAFLFEDEAAYTNFGHMTRAKLDGGGGNFDIEYPRLRKDGTVIDGDHTVIEIRDEAGERTAYVGIIRDITERKQAQRALAERETLYSTIIDTTSEGCLRVSGDGMIEDVNEALCVLLGYSRDDLLGRVATDLVDDANRAILLRKFEQHKKVDQLSGDLALVAKDGRDVYFRINATTLKNPDDGSFQGVFVFLADVTEGRALQKQLIRAQKIEAVGVMAGGIAHDFNNIISGVLGHAFLARMDLPEGNRAHFNLAQIEEAGTRARDLVRELMAFGRQQESTRAPTLVGVVILEVLKLIGASVPSTIQVRNHISAQEDFILADANQIYQVLMNLCNNAVDAIGADQGAIDINLKRVEITEKDLQSGLGLEPGPHVLLSVTDDGCGMDTKTQDHIFDPFYTTKEVGSGTGLGLSAVHGIVKDHKGAVRVQSAPGKGTTFELFFPWLDEAAFRAEQEARAAEMAPTADEQGG
jgi:two-component system, cell cycle sensor histidine kinase and response regulator CckA